jgi:hypothetical protein
MRGALRICAFRALRQRAPFSPAIMVSHMTPAMVLHSLGLTVAELEAAGADPYDLEALKRNA